MGTAEQNRAPGQRGQRAGIPFAAGRANGTRVVSDVGRDSLQRPRAVETRGKGPWGDSGTECRVRPALPTPCTPPAMQECLVTQSPEHWIGSLALLLRLGADLSGPWRLSRRDCSSLAGRQSAPAP